ncbi:catalase family peroxidase [Jiella sp. M17.18]|uniref:catalase family peroxidase n=1 Tax=Jiella sp. M17.18 TaxID=3234247 RepID=UPI0034DF0228
MVAKTALAAVLLLSCVNFSGSAKAADASPVRTAGAIVKAFDHLFGGPHEGYRAVHAKGVLLDGSFQPGPDAASLTTAVHLQRAPSPVLVRFSDFAGIPDIPDTDGAANPKGMAIKFLLGDGASTDIVAHSFNGFPAATPEGFLAFLTALGDPDKTALPAYAAAHPAAKRFLDAPKPAPASFATEHFFGVNAFAFTNARNVTRYGRYFIVPAAGLRHLSDEEAAKKGPNFLFDEIRARLARGPVRFVLKVQIAGPGDSLTDGAFPWPDDRPMVDLGTITLTGVAADNAGRQRDILFTPLSLVGGIAPSKDPMLASRTRAYRISHDRRTERTEASVTPR